MFCANLICLKGQRDSTICCFLVSLPSSVLPSVMTFWTGPAGGRPQKLLQTKAQNVWCSEITSQWLDEFSVRVSWWCFTRSLAFFTHRMTAYPSAIEQRGVYWEVTRDRDQTSMTWIKKKTKTNGVDIVGREELF